MSNNHNGNHPQRSAVVDIVVAGLNDVLAMTNGDASAVGEDTHLIGHNALLDSMGLVTLIVEVEQRLEEELDVALILADERAMSQKNSPFRSVASLADYIVKSMDESR